MRVSKDATSWKAGGILRRDFRHDYSSPEVPKGHPKRKQRKPRTKIDHKHEWVETKPFEWTSADKRWFRLQYGPEHVSEPRRPNYYITYECSISGCPARKRRHNPRYSYEMWKWRRARNRE